MAWGVDGVVHTVLITVVVYFFGQLAGEKRRAPEE